MKLLCMVLFTAATTYSLPAQTVPVQLWQSVEYVKSINLKGPTIALDKFQNTYMLTNQTDERPLGGFTLVKYDTSGSFLWKQNSTGSFAGIFYGSFTVDSLGNVYVSENYDGGLPGYDADAILVKYNPSGTKLWTANYGLNQSGDSYLYFSEMDTLNGRLIALGMNFHDTIPGENFLFVQAVDTSDGQVVWRTKIPGIYLPQNVRIQMGHIQVLSTQYKPDSKCFVNTLIDFEGNVMAQYEKPYSGYTVDFNHISKTGDVIFGNRAFGYNATRVNVQGDTLWAYEHPLNSGTSENKVISLVEDDSLNVYITGTLDLGVFSREMVSTKLDFWGNVIWQKIYHTVSDSFLDYGNHISIINDKVIVSGASQFANNDIVGVFSMYDTWQGEEEYTVFITNENVFRIEQAWGQKNKVFYTSMGYQSTLSNMVIVTGCFELPQITTTTNNLVDNHIIYFPNPTQNFLFVSGINTVLFDRIAVFDTKGNMLTGKKIESTEETISLSEFPPGLYVVHVYGNSIKVTKQVIKL